MVKAFGFAHGSRGTLAALLLLILLATPGCELSERGGDGGTAGPTDAGEPTDGGPETNGDGPLVPPDEHPGGADWRMAGQNLHNSRNQPDETVIGADNVAELVVKWQAPLAGGGYATPAVAEGSVWLPDSAGYLYRIDAATGEIVWRHAVADYIQDRKGDIVRATPAVTDTALIFGTQNGKILQQILDRKQGAYMLAVEKNGGEEVLWKKQVSQTRAPRITQSAVVYQGRVYVGLASGEENLALKDPKYDCCTHRGSALALDAGSGEVLHQEYMVPEMERLSGGSIWGSTAVIDEARNQVYFTTGNNYSVPKAVEDCLVACLKGACTQEEVRACLPEDNHFDSIVALDLDTLQIKWAHRGLTYDAWADPCVLGPLDPINCPKPPGPDFDFGQGPTLFSANGRHLVGAAQKSGVYWALDPDDGSVVWSTQVGPGGLQGGSEWGSAHDGKRIYVAISNSDNADWELRGSGAFAGFVVNRGFWSALDPATGEILWQTPEDRRSYFPLRGPKGPVTVANGVLYASSTTHGAANMYALDAATGKILWRHTAGKAVNSGPAVVDGVVYWATTAASGEKQSDSGYGTGKVAASGKGTLFAFCVAGTDGCPSA